MSVEAVIACQAELIVALDAQDPDAVMLVTQALAEAVGNLREPTTASDRDRLIHGLKQAEAARIRVKYLTAWNRQKIDRLAEYRGQSSTATYGKARLYG